MGSKRKTGDRDRIPGATTSSRNTTNPLQNPRPHRRKPSIKGETRDQESSNRKRKKRKGGSRQLLSGKKNIWERKARKRNAKKCLQPLKRGGGGGELAAHGHGKPKRKKKVNKRRNSETPSNAR